MSSTFALLFVLATGAGQIPGVPTGAPKAKEAAPTPASVAQEPCSTPRAAVITWLGNLQPSSYDVQRAALCTHPPASLSREKVQERVIQLKRVLDARGIFVRTENLPNEADAVDATTMRAEVPVTTILPGITVEKKDGYWGLSTDTVKDIPTLFADTFPLDIGRVVEQLPAWTKRPFLGVSAWQLGALMLLLLLGWLVRTVVAWIIANQIRRVMERYIKVAWGQGTIGAAAKPIGMLAMAGVLWVGLPSLQFGVNIAAILTVAVHVLAATSFVLIVYRFVDVAASVFEGRANESETKLDDQLVPLVRRAAKILIVCIGVVFVLQNLEVDVGSLIAGLGIGGLAVALAAKDTVSHIFGSVTIFLDKPFQIGDWVSTCGAEGIVEEVGFRSTRIRTFYNSVVTVPNGKFTDATVDNYGLRQFRRWSTTVTVPFSTPPDTVEAFCDGVRGIVAAHPCTRKDYYEVHVAGFGESGLNIMLYIFFDVGSWTIELRSRHEVILDIMRLADELDMRIAVPTQAIHIDRHVTASEPYPVPTAETEALRAKVSAFGPSGALVIPPGPRVGPTNYAPTADPDRLRNKA